MLHLWTSKPKKYFSFNKNSQECAESYLEIIVHSRVFKKILLLGTKTKPHESALFINTGAFIYGVLIPVSQQSTLVSTLPHRQQ